jgi:phage-related protein
MSWKITFFNQKVETGVLAFPAGILANFLHISEMIEEFGPTLGKPHTAPIGNGLFEIRAKGKEIVILHSFIKKTQRTPKKELEKARRRLKELD